MEKNKNIFEKFIDNLERISVPIHAKTMLHFKNINKVLMVRIYKKNHELVDEKEITSNGEFAIFTKLPRKGDYFIEFIDENSYYEKEIRFR